MQISIFLKLPFFHSISVLLVPAYYVYKVSNWDWWFYGPARRHFLCLYITPPLFSPTLSLVLLYWTLCPWNTVGPKTSFAQFGQKIGPVQNSRNVIQATLTHFVRNWRESIMQSANKTLFHFTMSFCHVCNILMQIWNWIFVLKTFVYLS